MTLRFLHFSLLRNYLSPAEGGFDLIAVICCQDVVKAQSGKRFYETGKFLRNGRPLHFPAYRAAKLVDAVVRLQNGAKRKRHNVHDVFSNASKRFICRISVEKRLPRAAFLRKCAQNSVPEKKNLPSLNFFHCYSPFAGSV